jgi:hypothetical protein
MKTSDVQMVWMPLDRDAAKAVFRAGKTAARLGLQWPRLVLPADELARERDMIFDLIPAFRAAIVTEEERSFAVSVLKQLDDAFVIVQRMMDQGERFDRKAHLKRLRQCGT